MLGDMTDQAGKQPLGEKAYQRLREAIVSLQLKPGQMVYESELAELLNVSRTPVREAIRTLVVDDLIDVLPQRGMKVALISETKVEEVRFVREVLEVAALKEGIRKWADVHTQHEDIQESIEMCLRAQERAHARHDIAAFLEADEEFHRAISMPSDNHTLRGIITQMRAHLNRIRMLSLRELDNVSVLMAEHKVLYRAIVDQDEATAVETLTRHLQRLNQDLPIVKQHFPEYFAP